MHGDRHGRTQHTAIPEAFGTGVTVLAGTRWLPKNRDDIMAGVSQEPE